MLLLGIGACDVSSEGLGALAGGSGEPNASGNGETGGTNLEPGNPTGQDAGAQPSSGGVMGAGGVMGGGGTLGLGGSGGKGGGGGSGGSGGSPGGGGRGGANAGGMTGMAAGGSAPNMGGMVGMNAGGVTGMAGMNAGGGGGNTGGTNTGGATGTGGMNAGGMGGSNNIYNRQPTPGKVHCGNNDCNEGEYCCVGDGPDTCQTRGTICAAGVYRACDDQHDCSSREVCCGGIVEGNFSMGCIRRSQCSDANVLICANSSECGDEEHCCAKSLQRMTTGVCARTCQ